MRLCCLRIGGQVKAEAICLPCWSSVCLTVIVYMVHTEWGSTVYNACSHIYSPQVKSPVYRCAQHPYSWQVGSLEPQSAPPHRKGFPSNSEVHINLRAGVPSMAGLRRLPAENRLP